MTADKPTVKLTGEDGNINKLVSATSKALKKAGLHEEAEKMKGRVMNSANYGEALEVIQEYVEIE